MISSGTSTFLFQPGAILIVSSIAGPCECGRAAFLFINRNGKTHCLFCEHNLAEMGIKLSLTAEEQHQADVAELTNDLTRWMEDQVAAGRYYVSGYTHDGRKLYREVDAKRFVVAASELPPGDGGPDVQQSFANAIV